ncbi:kelch-like protein 3 [Drosophila tropicalis]|uniref:kelch-like protein 3 n=1 Tax=Drosophila tropicalis TaxID=46794 RepID=UPI0035ABC66C
MLSKMSKKSDSSGESDTSEIDLNYEDDSSTSSTEDSDHPTVVENRRVKLPTEKVLPSSASKAGDAKKIGADTETDAAPEKWRILTDEEYTNAQDIQVPDVSLYSFYPYKPKRKIKIYNNPPKQKLSDIVKDMIKDDRAETSRVLIGEDYSIKCSGDILRCYSRCFSNRDWRVREFKFNAEDVPAKGFELAYKWMRFRELPAAPAVAPMLQVAKKLKIDLLERDCWKLLSQRSVREKVAMEVYMEARKLPLLNDLKAVMLSRLRAYFLGLVGHNSFLDLTVDELVEIISLDSIGVNSEIEVFLAVLRWLNHMPEQRQKHLRRTMAAVRFPYMPMSFLFRLKDGCNAKNKVELFSADPMLLAFHMDPQTPALLESAMTFIGVRLQHTKHGEFVEVCAEHKLKVQYPRRWIYHMGCPYHIYDLSYPFQHRFSKLEFNDLLCSLQIKWADDGADIAYGEARTIDIPPKKGKERKKDLVQIFNS